MTQDHFPGPEAVFKLLEALRQAVSVQATIDLELKAVLAAIDVAIQHGDNAKLEELRENLHVLLDKLVDNKASLAELLRRRGATS